MILYHIIQYRFISYVVQYHSNHKIPYNNKHIYQASSTEVVQGFLSILDKKKEKICSPFHNKT